MVKKQNLSQNDQILASTEFSRHTHYDFLKVDHKNNFHIKNYEYLLWSFEVISLKGSKNGL